MFSIKNYHSGAWVDVSDYLNGCSNIPFISMNSDWTLRVETISLEMAGSIDTLLTGGFSFGKGNKIKIEYNSIFLFGGYIKTSSFNYKNRTYELEVESSLGKLRDSGVDYTNLHDLFASGTSTQYWTDYLNYNSVQVLWALEKAFSLNGLTLSVPSGIKTTILFTRTASTGAWTERIITYADLYFDEYQLYCLGVSSAVRPTTGYTVHGYRQNDWELAPSSFELVKLSGHEAEVNCLEFASEIFTSLRLTVKQTDIDSFEVIALTSNGYVIPTTTQETNYSIDNDDKYNFINNDVDAESDNIGYSHSTLAGSGSWSIETAQRNKYYSETETQISETNTEGDIIISVMKNFTILFADAITFSSEYHESSCELDLLPNLIIDNGSVTARLNPMAMRYKSVALDRTIEEIESPIKLTFNTVVENFIDIENRTSNIIQENYI